MEKIWLIGTGVIGIEYAKILIALNVEFLAIGQGSEKSINFEKLTMHPAIQGGLKEFLESNPEPPVAVIVAIGGETLSQITQLLQEYGIKNIMLGLEKSNIPMSGHSIDQKPTYGLFTVIIPTYNRPEYLKRILSYYLSFEVKIIVADASDEVFPYLSLYKDQIEYSHTPNMDMVERVNKVTSLIYTPYVLLCADDDFIVPDAVNRVVAFLEENPDYASGVGNIIVFGYNNNDLLCTSPYKNMFGENIAEDSPSRRVLHLMNNFIAVFYSVHRTAMFKEKYESMFINNKLLIKQTHFHEWYASIYPLIEGKFIVLPLLYQAREDIWNSAGRSIASYKMIVSIKRYRNEYKECVALLATHLSKKEGISFDNAKNIIKESILRFLNDQYPKDYTIRVRIIPEIKYRTKFILIFLARVILRIVGLYNYAKKKFNKYSQKKRITINASMPFNPVDTNDMEQWNIIRDYIIKSKVNGTNI